MRTALCVMIMLLAGLALAADDKEAAQGPLTVPKEAVKVDNLTWRYKDAEGKTWIYRRTPFGLVRFAEEEQTAEPASDESLLLTAFDEGDSVRFEKKSPFGVSRWTRKKSELTDVERKAWERAQETKRKAEAGAAKQE